MNEGAKTHKKAVHIFRRDLRLEDNTGLFKALENSQEVLACFILDSRQLQNHEYKSVSGLQFMLKSLEELNQALEKQKGKLYLFEGTAEEIVKELIQKEKIDAIYFNKDYTSFARKRDEAIQKICKEKGIYCEALSDALLTEPEQVHKDDGKPYTIFTPFYRKAKTFPVRGVQKSTKNNFYTQKVSFEASKEILKKYLEKKNEEIFVKGGRKEGLELVHALKEISDYDISRDFPAKEHTSKLSAHHKFGTVSIREVYAQGIKVFGKEHTFISELYWRDFFTHIAFHFPRVFQGAFSQKYDAISWAKNKEAFEKWKEGKTGFPIVDAGMRELNATGYMHNRVRMIVASFLVKDLHINWREGEKYFAKQLVDYDPAVNNGNWQWAASTGCDAQPYFRIFNPWRQQERFDENCEYIKKWVPELQDLSAKEIHKLHTQRPIIPLEYPKPMVDHKEVSAQAKALFVSVRS